MMSNGAPDPKTPKRRTYRTGRRSILVADPHQKAWVGDWVGRRAVKPWVLWFGQCAPSYVLTYAESLEAALESAAGLLVEHGQVGHFVEPEMEDGSTHDCPDAAEGYPCTCDLTYTESGWIPGWEWGIALESPSREDLIRFHKGGL